MTKYAMRGHQKCCHRVFVSVCGAAYVISNGKMIDERWSGKDLGGHGHNLIELLSGRIETNYKQSFMVMRTEPLRRCAWFSFVS